MPKFKAGDRVCYFQKGAIWTSEPVGGKGTIYRIYESRNYGTSASVNFDDGRVQTVEVKCLKLLSKFSVGQIYKVGICPGQEAESENIIRITNVYINECGFEHCKYRTIRGNELKISDFGVDSPFDDSLTLLTGKEIGEAIKAFDEKKTGGVREVKRKARVGEWIKVLTGDGHHAPVGGILKVKSVDTAGWATVIISTDDDTLLRFSQYIVLEGYKPEQKGNIQINGKHIYTAEQIEKAKKLCGEMMVEAFEEEKTFSIRFHDNANKVVLREGRKPSETDCTIVRLTEDSTATSKCSDNDEYNVWIGRCVALCKVLHKPIPSFIMGDGKGRHFDFEKAKQLGYDAESKNVAIHCKNGDEVRKLADALDALGYVWGSGRKLAEESHGENVTYHAYKDEKRVYFSRDTGAGVSEFSDCFTED